MNISLKILLLLISSVIFTWIFVLHVPKGGGQFHSVIYVVLRTFFAAKKCATLLHVVTIHLHVWLDNSSKHTFKFTARLTTWYRVDSLLGITVIYIYMHLIIDFYFVLLGIVGIAVSWQLVTTRWYISIYK